MASGLRVGRIIRFLRAIKVGLQNDDALPVYGRVALQQQLTPDFTTAKVRGVHVVVKTVGNRFSQEIIKRLICGQGLKRLS